MSWTKEWPEDCPCCAGTGEGPADGTRCPCCNGRGYDLSKAEQEEPDEWGSSKTKRVAGGILSY